MILDPQGRIQNASTKARNFLRDAAFRAAPATLRTSLCALLIPAAGAFALEQTRGVNLTAEQGFGARQEGMAVMRAGWQQGADAVFNAPAAMNDVNDFTFSTGHAEQFGFDRLDHFALLVPFQANGTLGLGLARYAVSGIDDYNETDGPVSSVPDGVFSTSDWMVTGAFARRFGAFDIGGAAHILYRHLDQNGLGMRGDVMGQYTWDKRFRAGAYVRGLVPSTATWEEGLTETEAPDASLFVAGLWPLPYFYGSLQAGFETPGLLQQGARSSASLEGARGVTDPVSALRTSKVGAEFNFDFGLSLRAGLDELAQGSSARLGIGYSWRHILAVDYAYSAHRYLDQSHRVSLNFTPAFPKFQGRDFRPRPATPDRRTRAPGPDFRPNYPAPYTPGNAPGKAPENVTPATPGSPRNAPAPEQLEEELEEGEMQEIIK